MRAKSFSEVHADFKLADLERNWHNRYVKLSKSFWCLSLYRYLKNESSPNEYFRTIVTSYTAIFYNPFEILHWIMESYNGNTRKEFSKLKFSHIQAALDKKIKEKTVVLEDVLRKYLIGIKEVSGKRSEISLTEFDNHHTHLNSVSECFELILDGCQFTRIGDTVLIHDFQLKPSTVRDFNRHLNTLIHLDSLRNAYQKIDDLVTYGPNPFSAKITVESPTQALRDAIITNPEIMQLNDKRIKYMLSMHYEFNRSISDSSIQKAISRFREKDNGRLNN